MTVALGRRSRFALGVLVSGVLAAAPPPRARATPLSALCKGVGFLNRIAGGACKLATSPGRVVGAVKKVVTGHPVAAVKQALGVGETAASAVTTAGALTALGLWAVHGARAALRETATVVSRSTEPQLGARWFLVVYERVGGVAALLTIPFLAAAAVQAISAGDIAMLARSALQYLPLALVGVALAGSIVMLLLSATDALSRIVAGTGSGGMDFLAGAAQDAAVLGAVVGSPFLTLLVAVLAALGALALWVELLLREAAVYVIVLMLPLAFAALVWPARRMWAIRAVELLVSLILAKLAIVAVLSLGGAAYEHAGSAGLGGLLAGGVLVLLAAFAPWAIIRFVPLAELASGAVAGLRGDLQSVGRHADRAQGEAATPDPPPEGIVPIAEGDPGAIVNGITTGMRRDAEEWEHAAAPSVEAADDEGGSGPGRGGAPEGGLGEPEPAAPADELSTPGRPVPVGGASATVTDGAGPPAIPTVDQPAGGPAAAGPPAEVRAGSAGLRAPGLAPMYQQPDLTWEPLELGPDAPWIDAPPEEWARGEARLAPGRGAGAGGASGGDGGASGADGGAGAAPPDHQSAADGPTAPLPEPPEPPDGLL